MKTFKSEKRYYFLNKHVRDKIYYFCFLLKVMVWVYNIYGFYPTTS